MPDNPVLIALTSQSFPPPLTDFEVQIDIELPRPVSEVQQPEAKVVSFDLEDEFWKVKVMLNELNLESLEEIFVENAVMVSFNIRVINITKCPLHRVNFISSASRKAAEPF